MQIFAVSLCAPQIFLRCVVTVVRDTLFRDEILVGTYGLVGCHAVLNVSEVVSVIGCTNILFFHTYGISTSYIAVKR